MSVATSVEAPSDAELISAVRGGDLDAYGALFERHVDAARRFARQLVASGDAEDLAEISVSSRSRTRGAPAGLQSEGPATAGRCSATVQP